MSETTASKKRSWRKKKTSDGSMELIEHFQELRQRLIKCICALFVGLIIGYIWYQHSLFFIPSLGDIMLKPYCALPVDKRAFSGADGQCRFLATAPFDMIMLRIKMGAIAGAVLVSPIFFYQIWSFITPGLMKNERRWARRYVSCAVLLFLAGCALAYAVLFFGLELLLTIGDKFQTAALTGKDYFSFVLNMFLLFGISFQVPLLLVLLNQAGLLSYKAVSKRRDITWILLAIFAAFMTPGQDPYGMVILAVTLCIMVEFSFQIMRLNDKRRKKDRPDWLDTADDTASSLAPTTHEGADEHNTADSFDSSILPAQPIERPQPIAEPSEDIHTSGTDHSTNNSHISHPFDDVI
ncbi:twin-arginine translocase subunit TatC [Corynebacterium sp. sy017]|uniref:twin-arginine translocase subunit TatC n=1 Tax=unclassified Corynebacterium TaxID=2624378 RepID=UPI0011856AD6|nr:MULTISPECIES: twin-arginine translocase subunit TatC [unclassified Corynebacterium]MBP3087603.1 twin-arginine translocase subunit TatC [Corynebacterium sp. sy017]TSD92172.1 twin-arginine translocase subunit TatC [Corynebacterium sp. SY003]